MTANANLADGVLLVATDMAAATKFTHSFTQVWRAIPATDRKTIRQLARNGGIRFELQDVVLDPETGKPAWGLTSKKGRRVAFRTAKVVELPDGPLGVLIAHELAHVYRWAAGKHNDNRDLEEKATNRQAAGWGLDRGEWTMHFADGTSAAM